MPQRRSSAAPRCAIVTLLTDFGAADSYAAEMKGVLLRDRDRLDPAIVDITHQIPPQDVLAASFTLDRALRAFPAGTIHIAVVDPGVGSGRRILIARINRQLVIAPDNGLITWPVLRFPTRTIRELTWRPGTESLSATFHGRDIFAPAALALAGGASLARLSRAIVAPVMLPIHPVHAPAARGLILHFDHFGNASTNIPAEALPIPPRSVRIAERTIRFVRTYSDVPPARPLALIGSSGLLEIAIRNGSARRSLKLRAKQPLTVQYP